MLLNHSIAIKHKKGLSQYCIQFSFSLEWTKNTQNDAKITILSGNLVSTVLNELNKVLMSVEM